MKASASVPIILIFDLSGITAGRTREWVEFSRLGDCILPQPVLEEIQFFCDRAPEPELEQTAREFARFYPQSGWELTALSAPHPTLQPAPGENLSKHARLSLAVAQCAYGLADSSPDSLVVLITNEQPLLKKIQALGASNLCGIPVAQLMQWSRTKEAPASVSQKIPALKLKAKNPSETSTPTSGFAATPTKSTGIPTKSTAPATRPTTPEFRPPVPKPAAGVVTATRATSGPGCFGQVLAGFLALASLTLASLVLWRVFQPASFYQSWQQLGLPNVPVLTPARSPSPSPKPPGSKPTSSTKPTPAPRR